MCIINGHGFLKMIIYTYTRIVVLIYIRSLCTLAHDEADIRITQCRSSIKLYSPCIPWKHFYMMKKNIIKLHFLRLDYVYFHFVVCMQSAHNMVISLLCRVHFLVLIAAHFSNNVLRQCIVLVTPLRIIWQSDTLKVTISNRWQLAKLICLPIYWTSLVISFY